MKLSILLYQRIYQNISLKFDANMSIETNSDWQLRVFVSN